MTLRAYSISRNILGVFIITLSVPRRRFIPRLCISFKGGIPVDKAPLARGQLTTETSFLDTISISAVVAEVKCMRSLKPASRARSTSVLPVSEKDSFCTFSFSATCMDGILSSLWQVLAIRLATLFVISPKPLSPIPSETFNISLISATNFE